MIEWLGQVEEFLEANNTCIVIIFISILYWCLFFLPEHILLKKRVSDLEKQNEELRGKLDHIENDVKTKNEAR